MRPSCLLALAALLDPVTLVEGYINGVLLSMPLYTLAAIFLFILTGLPCFLVYACVGGAGNVVLVRAMRMSA